MIKRDENGLTIDMDLLVIYLILLIAIVVGAIKAIRWAVTS